MPLSVSLTGKEIWFTGGASRGDDGNKTTTCVAVSTRDVKFGTLLPNSYSTGEVELEIAQRAYTLSRGN